MKRPRWAVAGPALVAWLLVAMPPAGAQREPAVSDDAMRHNNLGVGLMDAGTRDPKYLAEAVREFEAALARAPSYGIARLNLGIAQYYAGDTPRSAATLEQVLAVRRGDPHAHYVLGLLREYAAQHEAAVGHFRTVTEHDRTDPDAWYHLGFNLARLGRHGEAIGAYRRAATITPYQKRVRYALFMALTRDGRKVEAQAELEAFRALGASQVRVVDGPKNALEYLKQGRYAEAIADSRHVPASPRRPGGVDVASRVGITQPPASTGPLAASASALLGGAPSSAPTLTPAVMASLASAMAVGAALVDVDGDGRLDVYTVSGGAHALFLQRPTGRFVRSSMLPAVAGISAAVWGDLDNDGTADLVIARAGSVAVHANRRGILAPGRAPVRVPPGYVATGLALADVDHDGDLDIAVAGGVDLLRPPRGAAPVRFPDGLARRPTLLLRNNNDGTYLETGRASGLADVGVPAFRLWFGDVDDDRAVDAVVVGADGTQRVLLNRKDGTFAGASVAVPPLASSRLDEARAFGDVDRDGAIDELLVDPRGVRLHRNTTPVSHWLTVRARGYAVPGKLKSNRLGIGSRLEVRSPGLWERREIRAGNGMGGTDAAEVTFDLGAESRLDFVRVVFPSGVRRTETGVRSGAALELEEPLLDVNSCPTIFTWDGERFAFVTDTLSAGILGELVAPGQYWRPDPDEWVRIDGSQLRSDDQGHLAIRFTNPLEEVTYLDAVRLVAVDHPVGVAVYSDERMRGAPGSGPVQLFGVASIRQARRVTDHHGHDVGDLLAVADRRSFDHFTPRPFKGFAGAWALTVDLGDIAAEARPVLGLEGWSYWNSSAAVVAASQAGERLWGPTLEVRDLAGRWRLATDDLGLIAGLPRTMAVDLRPYLRPGENVVRIRGNRTLYYDRLWVGEASSVQALGDTSGPALPSTMLPTSSASLRWLGYPRRSLPDGRLPDVFDYQRLEPEADWGTHAGWLTRYGDVRALLDAADDRMVVMGHGEEVALRFDGRSLRPLRPGWTRTWFFYANGFEKGYEITSAHAETVDPLPFQGMPGFPFDPTGAPVDPAYLQYQFDWNTRPAFLRVPH